MEFKKPGAVRKHHWYQLNYFAGIISPDLDTCKILPLMPGPTGQPLKNKRGSNYRHDLARSLPRFANRNSDPGRGDLQRSVSEAGSANPKSPIRAANFP
jgi:hypothetical protein